MMPVPAESEENLIFLCRLVGMIMGYDVLCHEWDTISPNENHIFYKEIMEKRKTSPIIPTLSEKWHGTDLISVKTILKALVEYDDLGLFSMENWGNSISNASSIIKNYISVVRYIHTQMMDTVMRIAKIHGIEQEIASEDDFIAYRMKRPSTTKKPYHLHISMSSAGGGNLNNIIQRLELEEHVEGLQIFPVKSWSVLPFQRYQVSKVDFNRLFMDREMLGNNIDSICYDAFGIARMLESSAEEMEDLHHELVGWRMLPCAMALHERLGGSSLLGIVGMDVMKFIMKFI